MSAVSLHLFFLAVGSNVSDRLSLSETNFLRPHANWVCRPACLLSAPTVQRVLGLSDEQKAAAELLRGKVAADLEQKTIRLEGEATVTNGVFLLTFDENDRVVREILDESQQKLLSQIQLQGIGPLAFFRLRVLAKYLSISETAASKLNDRMSESDKQMRASLADLKGEDRLKRMLALRRELRVDPLSVLDADQAQKAKAMLGGPQPVGTIRSELGRIWGSMRALDSSPALSALGDPTQPFRLLFADALLVHLNVNEEQRKRLVELVQDERKSCQLLHDRITKESREQRLLFESTQGLKKRERVAKSWSDVESILDQSQVRRLREAWYQVQQYSEVFSTTALSKRLGITEEQRDRAGILINERARNAQEGIQGLTPLRVLMGEILTEKQRQEFDKELGRPIPPHVLTELHVVENGVFADKFGIPKLGIGAIP